MIHSVALRTEGLVWGEARFKYEIKVRGEPSTASGCLTLWHKSSLGHLEGKDVVRVTVALDKQEMVDLRFALGLALRDMGCPAPF